MHHGSHGDSQIWIYVKYFLWGDFFVKLFLKRSLCVAYLITVKLVRDECEKPRVHLLFQCFPVGSAGMLPRKILKIRCSGMLFPAISTIHLLRRLVVYILCSHATICV